jgi:hypothetical protein
MCGSGLVGWLARGWRWLARRQVEVVGSGGWAPWVARRPVEVSGSAWQAGRVARR